jgi:hypothetical protein
MLAHFVVLYLRAVFGSAVKPEHRAKFPVVPPCELDRKLCLAHSTKTMKYKHFPAAVFSPREKNLVKFLHVQRPLY